MARGPLFTPAVRGILAILAAAVLIGGMAVCVRVATQEMVSAQVTFFRFAGALALLLLANGRASLRPNMESIFPLFFRGLFGTLAILLYFRGIEGAGAGLATLLHATYPVHTAWISACLGTEPLRGRTIAAVALSAAGAFVLLGPGANLSSATARACGFALTASILAGAAIVTARHVRHREPAMLVTVYFMLVGTIGTAPALLVGLPPFSVSLAASLAGVAATSAGAQWLLHYGLGTAPAVQGSLAAATAVFTAAILEAIFLGSTLSLRALPAGALLIGAVVLASRSADDAEPEA